MEASAIVALLVSLEERAMENPWSAAQLEAEIGSPGSRVLFVDSFGRVAGAGSDTAVPPPGSPGTHEQPPPQQPIGYALLRLPDDAAEPADLLRIGVVPEHRRLGHAAALLQAGTSVAHRATRRLLLEVSAGNGAALALYLAHGFQEIHRRRDYYPDGSDAVIMEKVRPVL